jgi:hypothetical protein
MQPHSLRVFLNEKPKHGIVPVGVPAGEEEYVLRGEIHLQLIQITNIYESTDLDLFDIS